VLATHGVEMLFPRTSPCVYELALVELADSPIFASLAGGYLTEDDFPHRTRHRVLIRLKNLDLDDQAETEHHGGL
jgi:hypothetical protein